MDSLTHIVLGATLGEALAGHRLKKKAMWIGAVAQSIPDFDFLASFWSDSPTDLLAHRGFTHSLLFIALIAPALAWLARRWHKNDYSMREWIVFFSVQLFTHIFLDTFNAYGTGWFEPFSHRRLSFNVLFVADPLFTVWLIISSLALLTRWNNQSWRVRWTWFGLGMSVFYLIVSISSKLIVHQHVKENMTQQSLPANRYFTSPTPLNSLLWYIVISDGKGYHIGYRSVFDHDDRIDFQFFLKNDSLLEPLRGRQDVNKLIRFSQDYYVIRSKGDTLVFSDLRFGQAGGWRPANTEFVFQYYLNYPDQNQLVIQRGRFTQWTQQSVAAFWRRIMGN